MGRKKKDYLDYVPEHKLSDPDAVVKVPDDDNGIDLSAIAKEQEHDGELGDGEDSETDSGYIEDDADEDDEDSLFHD